MSINISDEKPEIYNEVELIELASRVDSKSNVLNRDYTLAHTDAPLEIFADKQISCAELTVEVLKRIDKKINQESLEEIKKKYNTQEITEEVQEEFLKLKQTKNDYGIIIKDMLIGDVTNKIVFTRSHEGRVLKAAISKGMPQQQEQASDKKAIDAIKSVFSKQNKKEQTETAE